MKLKRNDMSILTSLKWPIRCHLVKKKKSNIRIKNKDIFLAVFFF